MTKLHAISALACLLAAAPAFAAERATTSGPVYVAPQPTLQTQTDTRCGTRSLAVCTRERVVSLRQLSDGLNRAAAIKPDSKPQSAADQKALESYDQWLRDTSAEARSLAAQGERALSQPDLQMSFNLQYLALQSKMQKKNQLEQMVSNVMKTKHDTAKNSISNMR